MTQHTELAAYFAEAASWDADRAAQFGRRARVAWWVAGAGWICAIAGSMALLLLMPLKRVEPYVIRVDNATGIVDVVPMLVGTAELPELTTRYFLEQYVIVCERFSFFTAESDYEECGALQSPQLSQARYALWNKGNPKSPLNEFKDGTTVRTRVISVSFLSRANGIADLAQVRYVREKRAGGTGEAQQSHWIATVQYAYANPSENPKVRHWNPVGFKIVDFRAEPEVSSPSLAATGSDARE